MKKILPRLGLVLLTILSVIVLLFSVGTVFTVLPVVGSVANIVTVGFLHLWLPLCVLLFLGSLVLFLVGRKKKLRLLLLILAVISLGFTVFFTCFNTMTVINMRIPGLKPNVFPSKEDVSAVTVETYTYTESAYGSLQMDVYRLDDGAQGKPVMIYLHGGGWIQGSRTDHSYYSQVFANHGYVVFCPDYDLSGEERHLADTTEKQLLEAFAWVKQHAGDFGGDISRLYVTGGSAGGNLALEISYKIAAGVYTVSSDGTALPTVRAVSVTFPVVSMEDFYRNNDLVFGSMARRMAGGYTGCTPEEDPELYAGLNPINSVSPQSTPTCILVGEGDALVPPRPASELTRVLLDAGVEHRTFFVPFANHIFDLVDGNMLNNTYLALSLAWFEQFS